MKMKLFIIFSLFIISSFTIQVVGAEDINSTITGTLLPNDKIDSSQGENINPSVRSNQGAKVNQENELFPATGESSHVNFQLIGLFLLGAVFILSKKDGRLTK